MYMLYIYYTILYIPKNNHLQIVFVYGLVEQSYSHTIHV